MRTMSLSLVSERDFHKYKRSLTQMLEGEHNLAGAARIQCRAGYTVLFAVANRLFLVLIWDVKGSFISSLHVFVTVSQSTSLLLLAFFHGGRGRPLRQFAPRKLLPLPKTWSENNSITKEICITVDFAPPPPWKNS